METWRLINYQVADAADNMAIDEAILDAYIEGNAPPTLRLYGWAPPAVSIGYAQRLSDDLYERINRKGYDIVRRATGGRAVLHDFELTYSFVAGCGKDAQAGTSDPAGFVLQGGVLKVYKQICQGLILAFGELGVEVDLGSASTPYKDGHDCFLATTSADLHFKGKKLVGSAQLRRKEAVLQHGSILLNQPQDLMRSLLGHGQSEPGLMTTPGLKTSGLSTPGLSTPGLSTPGLRTPGLSTPGLSTSGLSTPGLSTPGLSTPGLRTPGLSTPGLSTPGLSTPGLSTPGLSTPGLSTSGLGAGDQAFENSGASEGNGAQKERHANLFDIIGREIAIAELESCLRKGFEEAFQISFSPGPLSERERLLASQYKGRYLMKNR